ncbi:MAG: NADH-quinone oxidoreductase subunit N [Gemmataceae bacterium]
MLALSGRDLSPSPGRDGAGGSGDSADRRAGVTYNLGNIPSLEIERTKASTLTGDARLAADNAIEAKIFSAPVLNTQLSLFLKGLALITGILLVWMGWDEAGNDHAGEYHGCLLLIVAGISLVGAANDLATLFLALELVSIPTYVLLYLPRADQPAQEAAMKYFLLSVFSSGLMLFGFSYLYGLTGTTNIPGIVTGLEREPTGPIPWVGVSLLALLMVVAGLGFRITAVPFHFYAPDVYQGTTTPITAMLAFVPKVVGFVALIRLLGYAPGLTTMEPLPGRIAGEYGLTLGEQVPMLLWIMAAVTMTLGNILALLQDNIRRLIAYSSVAHAGYMLIGLAVVPMLSSGRDGPAPGEAVGGLEALLFYLVAYGAMTLGFLAVIYYLDPNDRPLRSVDDLAGLGKSHPGLALLLALFLFSLIGMPLTAGFAGKFMLFFNAMGLSGGSGDHARLFRILALIAAVNAAIGSWYYLRMIAVMYLREAIDPLPKPRLAPVVGTIAFCAILTLGLGVYPKALLTLIRRAIPQGPETAGIAKILPADKTVVRN